MQTVKARTCPEGPATHDFARTQRKWQNGATKQPYHKHLPRVLRENFRFSPSTDIDKTWEPVKKYQSDTMRASEKGKEKLYFDRYNPADL